MTLARSLTLIFHKSRIHHWVFVNEIRNHAPTLSSVSGFGNIWIARGKPLFFLNLDFLPRRIPQHYIKSPRPPRLLILWHLILSRHPENTRKSQVPVKELVLLSQAYDLIAHPD